MEVMPNLAINHLNGTQTHTIARLSFGVTAVLLLLVTILAVFC